MKKFLLSVFFFCCSVHVFYAQQEDGVVSFVIPQGNSLKFNSFVINPTFSFVKQQNTYITLFNKTQWAGFDNAPQTYSLNYSGRFSENSGVGLGVFQQSYGILSTTGIIANFAQNVLLQEDNNLTFGINVSAYRSGLNNGKVISESDPSLENIPSNTLVTINPGINYGTTFLDFGVAFNNLVTYNFKSGIQKEDPNKGIEAHIMYTGYLDTFGFFDKSKFSGLIKSEFIKDKTIISGSAMFTIPKGIWAQAGYNTVFGATAGIGLNITPKIAVEYSYGTGFGDISQLGASHIIVLAYKFKSTSFDYGDDEEEGALIEPAPIQKKVVAAAPKANTKAIADAKIAERKKILEDNKAKLLAASKAKADAVAAAKLKSDTAINLQKQKLEADAKAKADAVALANKKQDPAAIKKLAAENKAKADAEANAVKLAAVAKLAADKKAKADAEAIAIKLAAENNAKAKLVAENKTKADAENSAAKIAADNKAKVEAEVAKKLAAENKAKADAEANAAKLIAENKAKADAESANKLVAENRAKADAEAAAAKLVAENKAKADAEAAIKLVAESKNKADAEAKVAKLLAENKAKADAEATAIKLAAENKAKADAEAATKLAAENKAKADAEAATIKLAAENKAKADAIAATKLAAENKAKADAEAATIQLAAENKAKAEAEAATKLAAENKAKADAEAAIKLAAENKAKADAEAATKLVAENKAKADAEAAIKLAAENKAKADAEAATKLAAQNKAKADAEAATKLAAENKAKADAEAAIKLAAENKAKADAEAATKLAAQNKAKADAEAAAKLIADAKAKAKAIADADAANAKLAAENKAKADAQAEQDKIDAAAAEKLAVEALAKAKADATPKDEYGKVLDNLTSIVENSKKKQQQLLTRLDASVASKEKALKDLKEENDLSDKGIVKTTVEFKSSSGENAELESIRAQIADLSKSQSDNLAEFNRIYNERLKKTPKNDPINQNYLKTIEGLKAEQAKTEQSNAALIASLEKIKVETEIEKKRRIKRAVALNDQDRLAQDMATLKQIKATTKVSSVPLKVSDFDFGDNQSNMQIIKNNKIESGYYMILAVHNDVSKRDAFVTKTVAAGQSNVNFFYDANTSKYFIYTDKFDNIQEATEALTAKGSKPYNDKMVIVKIDK